MSPKRARNGWRNWQSYRQAQHSGRADIKGVPIGISFEPTTACNLRCPECPSGLRSFTRPTGNLRSGLFHGVLDEIGDELLFLNFYFQGEPYIHPQFTDLVSDANDRGIYTATSTNAHFMDEERAEKTVRSGLKRIIISIDGTDQDTYASYRKEGNLEKVMVGAKALIRKKRELRSRTPHVIFQFLVVRPNEHQVPEIMALGKRIGADEVRLKTAQVYDPRDDHPLIPLQDKYSRYQRDAQGNWSAKNGMEDKCWRMWHSCVITWDGKVVPCCFDKDAHHVLGQAGKDKFREIWTSAPYKAFREGLLRSRSDLEMCRNCSEGSPVWA